jgi:hypothetical protein
VFQCSFLECIGSYKREPEGDSRMHEGSQSGYAEPAQLLPAFGVILLVLNFLDGFYKLAKLDWHTAYRIALSLCYIALSVRLIQLIPGFRGE